MEKPATYLDTTSEDVLICGKCKVSYNSIQLFLEHKRESCYKTTIVQNSYNSITNLQILPNKTEVDKHTNQNLANIEDLSLNRQSVNYNLHIKTQENEIESIACVKCKKSFKKLKSLALHLKTHSGEKPYQCPICGRCFLQNTHLQRHLLSHKVWPDGLTDTTAKSVIADLLSYSCSYCDTVLSNYSQFRVHLKKHLSEKKFRCSQEGCLLLFNCLDTLLGHMSIAHKDLVYTCHICFSIFNSLEDIARHQQYHNKQKSVKEKKKYLCMHCDASFSKKDRLAFHLFTENHKKVCVHCKKLFSSDKRLRLHLQTHRQAKLFQCNICGSGFNVKKYLTSHMHKHGDRQFVCSICNFKFKRRDLLVRHLKVHQSRKKFQCPFKDKLGCTLEFTRRDKLNLHINYHMKRMTSSNKQSRTKTNTPSTLEILIVPLTSAE